MTVRVLERDRYLTWRQVDGDQLEQARVRVTRAAFALIEQAHAHGLAVHVNGTASTDVIGMLGHKLVISHRHPEPGRPRLTRLRLCRLDGVPVESRYTVPQARQWIDGQPRPLRRAPLQSVAV